MIIRESHLGDICGWVPRLNKLSWDNMNKLIPVSETICDKEIAFLPMTLREDMVGNLVDKDRLSDFNTYANLIRETPTRMGIEEWKDLDKFYNEALKTVRYHIYRIFNTVGLEYKGIIPFTTGHVVVNDENNEFNMTYFSSLEDTNPNSNWVFHITGNHHQVTFDDTCCVNNFTLWINLQANPIKTIRNINIAMGKSDWKTVTGLVKKIRDTTHIDGISDDSEVYGILDASCFNYNEYSKLVDSVNLEVNPQDRYISARKFIEKVATDMLIDYISTVYCIVFGHNRRRSKIDPSKSVVELINLGIQGGNIDFDDNKRMKVVFISDPVKRGRKPKEDTVDMKHISSDTVKVRVTTDRKYRLASWDVSEQTRHYKKSGKIVTVGPFKCYRHKGDLSKLSNKKGVVTFKVKQ